MNDKLLCFLLESTKIALYPTMSNTDTGKYLAMILFCSYGSR